jgi:hypothetical protein
VIVHLVLFKPRHDLSTADRDALLAAIAHAARSVPSVRRFSIGERIATRIDYVLGGFPDFPYVAVVECDDERGLREYLEHPAHVDLGKRFNAAAETALIYDFDVRDL